MPEVHGLRGSLMLLAVHKALLATSGREEVVELTDEADDAAWVEHFLVAMHHLQEYLAHARHLNKLQDIEQSIENVFQAVRQVKAQARLAERLTSKSMAERCGDCAIGLARRAVQLDASYSPGWHQLGVAYRAVSRFEEASSSWKRAIALDPRFREELAPLIEESRRKANK